MIIIDTDHNLPVYSEQCTFCKHITDKRERFCKAFPGGIPLEIWTNEFDHRNRYPTESKPTDNGFRFERVRP